MRVDDVDTGRTDQPTQFPHPTEPRTIATTQSSAGHTELLKFGHDGIGPLHQVRRAVVEPVAITESRMVDQQAFHATGTQTLDEPQHPRPAIRRPHSNTLRSVFDTKMPNARGSTQAWQIRCR